MQLDELFKVHVPSATKTVWTRRANNLRKMDEDIAPAKISHVRANADHTLFRNVLTGDIYRIVADAPFSDTSAVRVIHQTAGHDRSTIMVYPSLRKARHAAYRAAAEAA